MSRFSKIVSLLLIVQINLFVVGCKNENPTNPEKNIIEEVDPASQLFWLEQLTPYYAHHNGRGLEWVTYIKLNTEINLDAIECINWEIKTPGYNWQDKITGWQITYIDNDCAEPLVIRAKIKYDDGTGDFFEIVTTSSLLLYSQCSNLDSDPQYSNFGEKFEYCNL